MRGTEGSFLRGPFIALHGGYCMKWKVLSAILSCLFFSSAIARAEVCHISNKWKKPAASMKRMIWLVALAKAKYEFQALVSESKNSLICNGESYVEIQDLTTGRLLGEIPVPWLAGSKEKDGRFLLMRLKQLLQTPRQQLMELAEAKVSFNEDLEGLREDLQISAQAANDHKEDFETTAKIHNAVQNYFVDVLIEESCTSAAHESPSIVYANLALKNVRYIPGRKYYPSSEIYKKGDLRKAIFSDAYIVDELKHRFAMNMKYCRGEDLQFWAHLSARLHGPAEELLQSTSQRFTASLEKRKVIGAYLMKENRVAILYENGEQREFGGSISEISEIQTFLSREGILTEK